MIGAPTLADQKIGTGDGQRASFQLVKHYRDAGSGNGPEDEAQQRVITRPVAGTFLVSVNDVLSADWTIGNLGKIIFATPPAAGVIVKAGFKFDVPVRFADDRLEVSRATYEAGEITSVPLVEVKETA